MKDKKLSMADLALELTKKDAQSAAEARKSNTLSARQMIQAILDESTFAETGTYVRRSADSDEFEGVICGYGAIDSRLVFIFAQDFFRMKGAFDRQQAKKICDLYALAEKSGAPIIGIFNSAGACIREGVDALGAYGEVMRAAAKASGIIPQIAYIHGICAGSAAVISSMFDVSVSVKDKSSVYVNPPSLLSAKDAGSAQRAAKTGLVSKVYNSEAEAAVGIRSLINYLPQNNMEGTVTELSSDDLNRKVNIPATNENYDMKTILSEICDRGEFMEVSDSYAPEALCALGSIGSSVAGIIANQPSVSGGRLTPEGARKMAKFISLCDSFSIPIVTLTDSEGVAVDDACENAPLASELSRLAFAYANAVCPKITAIIGKAYGSAFTLMGSKAVGADIAFALSGAQISIMPPASAVAFLWNDRVARQSREEVEAEWAAEYATPVQAALHGEIDDIIEPAELRQRICAALSMLASKCAGTPARRHANLPL